MVLSISLLRIISDRIVILLVFSLLYFCCNGQFFLIFGVILI